MSSISIVATQKSFPELKEIDNLLKCGICYEYMKNTLMTSCSHNYCSYCIRKFMQYKNQCPTCFKETTEPQLRNNRLIDDLIVLFVKLKDKIEDLAAEKNWAVVDGSYKGEDHNKHLILNTPRNEAGTVGEDKQESPVVTTPKVKIMVPEMFTPIRKVKKISHTSVEKAVQLVPCPVCSVDIPERNINVHLDVCLAKSKQGPIASSTENSRRKPLPKLVYPLLNDKYLKQKLKEFGLNTFGDRKTLTNRHQRFTVLYNSECDSRNPRPVSEILEQVAEEESSEKKVPSQSSSTTNANKSWFSLDRKVDSKIIEEAQKEYLKENKNSFADLLEKVRKQEKKTTTQRNEVISNPSTSKESDPEEPENYSSVIPVDLTSPPESPEISLLPVNNQEDSVLHRSLHDLFENCEDSPVKPSGQAAVDILDFERSEVVSSSSFIPKVPKLSVPLPSPKPGSSRTLSPPCTPEKSSSRESFSNYSSYHQFSPNIWVKSPQELERTPSPELQCEAPSSPIFRKSQKGQCSKNPIIEDDEDVFENCFEVKLEEDMPKLGLRKRKKRSTENQQPNCIGGEGRTLRKRVKK